MERFSWPVHFRNGNIHRRDWRFLPTSGNIWKPVSPVFFLMPWNRPIRSLLTAIICVLLATTVVSAQNAKKASGSTSSKTSSKGSSSTPKKKHSKKSKKSSRARGQKAIDSERTLQIQEALIREHYLDGKPSGKWDDATQAAMRRYQADHGWQNKTVPDSRALIKLGLGPNHDHLLNPETAMTSGPTDTKTAAKPAIADPPTPSTAPASTPSPQQ